MIYKLSALHRAHAQPQKCKLKELVRRTPRRKLRHFGDLVRMRGGQTIIRYVDRALYAGHARNQSIPGHVPAVGPWLPHFAHPVWLPLSPGWLLRNRAPQTIQDTAYGSYRVGSITSSLPLPGKTSPPPLCQVYGDKQASVPWLPPSLVNRAKLGNPKGLRIATYDNTNTRSRKHDCALANLLVHSPSNTLLTKLLSLHHTCSKSLVSDLFLFTCTSCPNAYSLCTANSSPY